MNVEIVEFYLKEQNESKELLQGTIRIELPEFGIDILGIHVMKKKKHWFFSLPYKNGFDDVRKVAVRYPVFLFNEKEKQRLFIEAIRKKGIEFIEAWILKHGAQASSLVERK